MGEQTKTDRPVSEETARRLITLLEETTRPRPTVNEMIREQLRQADDRHARRVDDVMGPATRIAKGGA